MSLQDLLGEKGRASKRFRRVFASPPPLLAPAFKKWSISACASLFFAAIIDLLELAETQAALIFQLAPVGTPCHLTAKAFILTINLIEVVIMFAFTHPTSTARVYSRKLLGKR